MSELSAIYDRLGTIEREMVAVKTTVSAHHESYAQRDWVHNELRPIREMISQVTLTLQELQNSSSQLFASHEKFLQDESVRKAEMHAAELEALERKTVSAVVEAWASFAGRVMAIAGCIALLWGVIYFLVQAVTNVH